MIKTQDLSIVFPLGQIYPEPAAKLIMLSSGEWVPNLAPDEVVWMATTTNKNLKTAEWPEIPWFPIAIAA